MVVAPPEVGRGEAELAGGKEAGQVGVSVAEAGDREVGKMDGASAISAEEEEEDGADEDDDEGVKWLKHYSSTQSILVVGDGDFSFSRALAVAFCSGENLVSTSLDSYETLRAKYAKAESNIMILKMMGATTFHGVDAKTMKHHTDLKMRRFDRIVFNFPHAGFKGREDDVHLIKLHKDLVRGFFHNARHLLRASGEIHVSHKIGKVYNDWNIEQLASESSLITVEKVDFHIEDYPGYNHKRGDGPRCDEPFRLGPRRTFKFSIRYLKKKKKGQSNRICSISSLGDNNVHPEVLASDWSPSQPFRPLTTWPWSHFHSPANAVSTPVTFGPYSVGIAQRHQQGFAGNFAGSLGVASCSLQQGNIQPIISVTRAVPNLLPVVGGIAPSIPMGRITSTSLFEPQEQPRPILGQSQSINCSYYFAREYQMNLHRKFEMKRKMMLAGTSLDYFAFLEYSLRDPAEKEKWMQTMITLYASRCNVRC